MEHQRKLAKETKSQAFHRAANLIGEATVCIQPHDGLLAQAIYEHAKTCRDAGERALTVDG